MRKRWRYRAALGYEDLARHVNHQFGELSAYMESLDATVANGPVPGSYYPVTLTHRATTMISDPVADLVSLTSERSPVALSWTLKGSGSIQATFNIVGSSGNLLTASQTIGPVTGTGTGVIRGVFAVTPWGDSVNPSIWLDVVSVGGAGTINLLKIVIDCKAAGKIEQT